jgi:hypothetical protein
MRPLSNGRLIESTDNSYRVPYPEQMARSTVKTLYPTVDEWAVNQVSSDLKSKIAPRLRPGVCLAMSCMWLDQMLAGRLQNCGALMACKANAHRGQTTYVSDVVSGFVGEFLGNGGTNKGSVERQAFERLARNNFNLQPGQQTSAKFRNSSSGPDSFERSMERRLAQNGAYLFTIALEAGSHAMAFYVDGPTILFLDPEYGVYEYQHVTTCVRDVRLLVWGWDGPYRSAIDKAWSVVGMHRPG